MKAFLIIVAVVGLSIGGMFVWHILRDDSIQNDITSLTCKTIGEECSE